MSATQPTPLASEPTDPFRRELMKQLVWLTTNLTELNNNVAMVADWIQMGRDREARAKERDQR